MSQSQFRPRSPTEIVDAAMQLTRRHYQPLLVLSAIIAIPNVVLGLVTQWLVPTAVQASGELADAADLLLVFGLSFVTLLWMVIGFGALVTSSAMAYVDGRALEPMKALRQALRRAVPLVVGNMIAYLLVTIVLFVGLMIVGIAAGALAALLGPGLDAETGAMAAMVIGVVSLVVVLAIVVAGLVLWSRYVNVTAAVMLEGRGAWAAVTRSSELARGNVWRSAGVVLIMMVLYVVAFFTSMLIFMLLVRDPNLSASVSGVLVIALYPFLGTMLALLYFDLRIRREGYDLELMARALDGAGASHVDAAPAAGASA